MFSNLKADLKAGVVVFLVALPLCLGISLAQNAPPLSGLVAGIIGGIIVGVLSGSKLSVSGPAAGLTSVVLSSVTELGSFEAFLTAVCLAGVFQIALGALKAGIIGYYFPTAVIKGMLSGIGLILIMKEIPHLLGDDRDPQGDEAFFQVDKENTFSELLLMFDAPHLGSIIIGAVSLAILLLWQTPIIKKKNALKQIPPALLVVIVAIIIDMLFARFSPSLEVKEEHLVNLPEITSLDSFVGSFTHPDFSVMFNSKVLLTAAIIAGVASLETLLSLEAVDKLDPDNQISPTNRELVAQGVGNIASGLLGGLPITSVIVRSSANVNAGAKGKLSTVFHGFLIISTVLFIPQLLELIPYSALAAILILTGYNLCKPTLYKVMFRQGWDQFLPFIFTVIIMLRFGLLGGVTVGICISIIFILRQNYKAPFKMIREEIDGRMNIFIKLSQNVTFINKGKFIDLFKNVPPGAYVNIDGGRSTFIDKDVLELISAFKQSAHVHKITVVLEEVEEVEVLSNH